MPTFTATYIRITQADGTVLELGAVAPGDVVFDVGRDGERPQQPEHVPMLSPAWFESHTTMVGTFTAEPSLGFLEWLKRKRWAVAALTIDDAAWRSLAAKRRRDIRLDADGVLCVWAQVPVYVGDDEEALGDFWVQVYSDAGLPSASAEDSWVLEAREDHDLKRETLSGGAPPREEE